MIPDNLLKAGMYGSLAPYAHTFRNAMRVKLAHTVSLTGGSTD